MNLHCLLIHLCLLLYLSPSSDQVFSTFFAESILSPVGLCWCGLFSSCRDEGPFSSGGVQAAIRAPLLVGVLGLLIAVASHC